MLKIKEIKHGQIFYAIDDNGEPYSFKAWKDPFKTNSKWCIVAECSGNYEYTFDESDEDILYLTEDLV